MAENEDGSEGGERQGRAQGSDVLAARRAQILRETGIDPTAAETVRAISRGEVREQCVRAAAGGFGVTYVLGGIGICTVSILLGSVLILLGLAGLVRACRRGRRYQREVLPRRAARQSYIGGGVLELLQQPPRGE